MRLAGTKLAANHQYRGFGDQLYDLSGQRPSLDLNFANSKSLVDAVTGQNLVTFTRASSGTYVGSDGLIKTATTDTPRFDHNPTTNESLGLLVEESRTNLLLRSEEFGDAAWTTAAATVTSNTGVAPDGSSTADTITSSGSAIVSQATVKAASAITYTGSLFVKGTVTAFSFSIDDGATVNRGRVVFNLSTGTISSTNNDGTFTGTSGTITLFPNGWYKLTITTTTNSTTSVRLRPFWSGSGTSIDAWGAQLEAASFPTSYIPTTTATVTRSADVASITGANFSSWYRQDEGTVFISARTNATHGGVNSFPRIHAISDGTNDNVIQNYYRVLSSYTDAGYNITTLTVAQAGFDANNERNGQSQSTAYANNDFALAVNGSLVSADNTGTVPTVSQLRLGARGTGLGPLNGTIRRLTYWPQRLPNTTLQQITQ
jgi:hypothetical protein